MARCIVAVVLMSGESLPWQVAWVSLFLSFSRMFFVMLQLADESIRAASEVSTREDSVTLTGSLLLPVLGVVLVLAAPGPLKRENT